MNSAPINEGILNLYDLEQTIRSLVKGKSDLMLYGNKSSGKTRLALIILNDILGPKNFIHVKSIFASDRDSLLYLIGDELLRLVSHLYSGFLMDKNKEKLKFARENQAQTLEGWIKRLNSFIKDNEQFFKKLKHIYIFIDNIEDIRLGDEAFRDLIYALKRQIKFLKVSFLFCGVCHNNSGFSYFEPFRSIPNFVMPQPDIKISIRAAIEESPLYKRAYPSVIERSAEYIGSFQKLLKYIEKKLFVDFESSEYQLENVYMMSKYYLKYVYEYVQDDFNAVKIWMSNKNEDRENEILKELKSSGEIANCEKEFNDGDTCLSRENYPNLFFASIGMINGYNESDDLKRFIDMKKTKSKNGAGRKQKVNINMKVMSQPRFKQESKNQRHNEQRIISVAEVFEEVSEGLFGEKEEPHHSLDYYGCLEYLREEGSISYFGKGIRAYGGKIYAEVKESETQNFLAKAGIEYSQFCDKE